MADDDPFDSPEFKRYAQHVRKELIPMIRDSAVSISLVPANNQLDVKFAVELGYMIMLDKPIIAVVSHGVPVPAKLVLVADEIVEGELGDPDFGERFKDAISRVTAKLDKKGKK